MTKFAITLCIALALSTGLSQAKQPSTSVAQRNTISLWTRIRHPILSIQNSLKMKLDDILASRRTNGETSRETQILCDQLQITINDINRLVQEKESTLKLQSIMDVLPPGKTEVCVAIFSNWKDQGSRLANQFSTCFNGAITAMQSYERTLLDVQEIFPKVADYRNEIEDCSAVTGLASFPKSLGCTLWIYFKWTFFAADFPARMALSVGAREDLERRNYEMNNLEECNVESEAVKGFFSAGNDIQTRTHDCIIKEWSKSLKSN